MRIKKEAVAPPKLTPEAEAALRVPLERLKRGEAGLKIEEVARTLDQLEALGPADLRLARQLIIDADAASLELYRSTQKDPTRGAATPERIIQLLSGEAHGLKHLPTSLADAADQLSKAMGTTSDALDRSD